MGKRIYVPVAKEGQLMAKWGRPEQGEPPEIVYAWGGAGACKRDAGILMRALGGLEVIDGKTPAQELEARGYDLSTLKFTIEHKTDPANIDSQE